MQPGEASNKKLKREDFLNISRIISIIKADAKVLGFVFESIDDNTECPEGCYKIAFVIDNQEPTYDYHWYRQNSDGTWSHKPGTTEVTNLDCSGKIIMDPRKANRNAGYGVNYNVFVGFFVVKPLNVYYL